ncbi:hypothetical protein [Streptomyces sp. CLI2509]|uniref:hypothetical protein n=1 Tax=Streptomyces sp. CLI2509 TaxID=1984801 RepID=UPI000BAC81B5|nr:hypothetical protein [Streptomyces sp. CLI2509]ASY35065.1 hypothetical protein CAC01_22270 [Streptomyces sp. CLI2509]
MPRATGAEADRAAAGREAAAVPRGADAGRVPALRAAPGPVPRGAGSGAGAGADAAAGPAAPAARNASSPGIIGNAARCTGACGAGASTGAGAEGPVGPSALVVPASADPGPDTEKSGSAFSDVSSTPGPLPAPSAGLCHVASRPANPASATPAGAPPRAR